MRNGLRELTGLVDKIRRYAIRKSPDSFKGWTREAIEDYVLHHMEHGSIEVAMVDDEVVGLIIGWRQNGMDHIPWKWQKPDPKGDVYWYDQFMADCPQIAMCLAIYFCESHPDCVKMKGVGFRNGKLKRYNPGFQWKLYKKAEGLYGN